MGLTREQFDVRKRDGYDGCQVAGVCMCDDPSETVVTILRLQAEGHMSSHAVMALLPFDVPCTCGCKE